MFKRADFMAWLWWFRIRLYGCSRFILSFLPKRKKGDWEFLGCFTFREDIAPLEEWLWVFLHEEGWLYVLDDRAIQVEA